MKERKPSEFMSIREIADTLGISYMTATRLMRGEMAFVKVGNIYRVRREEFAKYLKRAERRSMCDGRYGL